MPPVTEMVLGDTLDATMQPAHGYFYRVVSINQTSTTSMDLEVQLPDGTPTLLATGSGVVVIMDNVVGVFDFKTF